jgi:nitrate/TMAO reductase-like tetraheme cytochrome c subunit
VREALTGKSAVEMPVFDEQAQHASRGAIGCPTCHDPHKNRADGLEPEVPGYFLRLADTKGIMCADCHKSSALFRYKFFHSDKSRRR